MILTKIEQVITTKKMDDMFVKPLAEANSDYKTEPVNYTAGLYFTYKQTILLTLHKINLNLLYCYKN